MTDEHITAAEALRSFDTIDDIARIEVGKHAEWPKVNQYRLLSGVVLAYLTQQAEAEKADE